jgi:hypothetical protein
VVLLGPVQLELDNKAGAAQSPTFTICSPSRSARRAMPHTLPQDATCARRGCIAPKAFVTQHLVRHELSAVIVAAHLGVTPLRRHWPGRAGHNVETLDLRFRPLRLLNR